MVWLEAEYELGGLLSYRVPDSSSQYAVASPLPGPSTIKLGIVSTAIETTGNLKQGEKIFELVKNAGIKMVVPKKIAIFNVLIKRLKQKKKEKKGEEEALETTFGIRGYAHFCEPIKFYIDVSEKEEIRNLLRKVRYFGTSDSIVYCRNVVERDPLGSCIEPVETLEKIERNVLVIRVKDLNPNVSFEHINVYGKTRTKELFIPKYYLIPIINQRQGKNWIIYQTKQ